jgi:hypothetical protein
MRPMFCPSSRESNLGIDTIPTAWYLTDMSNSLSPEQAVEITSLWLLGRHTISELAEYYGVSVPETNTIINTMSPYYDVYEAGIWPLRTCEKYDKYIRSHR